MSFPIPSAGPSDGNLCVKGRFGWDFIDHPDRIKTPLLRVKGEFKEASWEEALHFVAHGTRKDQKPNRVRNQSPLSFRAG